MPCIMRHPWIGMSCKAQTAATGQWAGIATPQTLHARAGIANTL